MLWLLVTANVVRLLILVTLMMEVIHSSETSVLTRATYRNIPDYGILRSHCRGNLISYTVLHVRWHVSDIKISFDTN
jgi:hypothetical protein